jgi:hypothetical protein
MKKVLDRLESNLSGCTLSIIICPQKTISNHGILEEKSFQFLSGLFFNGKKHGVWIDGILCGTHFLYNNILNSSTEKHPGSRLEET